MASIVLSLLLFLTIILLPKHCFACGVCVDYNIDYYLPFFKYWIPLFIAWALLRWIGNILVIKNKNQSLIRYILLSILTAFAYIVIASLLTMGSLQFPFILLFIWWLVNSILISVGKYPKKSYQAQWWKNVNRIMIGFTIILITYSYTFQFSDLDRLSKFIRYSGGPYSAVKKKVIHIGKPAIPMVIDELIIKESKVLHGGESSHKEGIFIVEQITGQNFKGSREELLKWWNQHK